MVKDAPPSPIKSKTSAFLHRLKKTKSDSLGRVQHAGGRAEVGAAVGSPPLDDSTSLVDLERQPAEAKQTDLASDGQDSRSAASHGLSAVSISTSPFLPSSDAFVEPTKTPPSAKATSLRVQTANGPTSTLDPADISLPLPSPSEADALTLTVVVELQAFVEKKRWIEQQIEVLRALEPVDCFAGCRPTFVDEDQPDVEAHQGVLPSKAEVEAMFLEHERIEAEAEQLDGGEISRLRQMAKAASQKSLSHDDTDLLDITLSTLFLLDTLLHLLRGRADTLDLLALRLDWDSRRLSIALDVRAIERDVKSFVEGKGRWSLEAYKQPMEVTVGANDTSGGSGSNARPARRGSDASIRSVSSVRSFGAGGQTASRSQRFLMTQIMELDCQSFQNRISTLRGGPVTHAGRLLDRMIDVAASIRARNQKRAAHELSSAKPEEDAQARPTTLAAEDATAFGAKTTAASVNGSDEGALPDWFLDEMDRIELKVEALRAWDELARAHARQWKLADQIYHTSRKIQAESEALALDINQAFLQHPCLERAAAFGAKAANLVSSVSVAGDLKAHPVLNLPYSLFAATSASLAPPDSTDLSVADLLSEEVLSSKRAAETALDLATSYRQLADRILTLEGLRLQMDELSTSLDVAHGQLDRGFPAEESGDALDLSSVACLQPGAHRAYLAQLPTVRLSISAASDRSVALVGEAAALLMALKTSGMDPNFRSSVQATSARLQATAKRAKDASARTNRAADVLAACRRISSAQSMASSRTASLRSDLLAALDAKKWTDPPPPSSNGPSYSADKCIEELASLVEFVASSSTESTPLLDDDARKAHPHVVDHLSKSSARLQVMVGSLKTIANQLLPAVDDQRQAVERLALRSAQLRRDLAAARASLARPPDGLDEAVRLEGEIEAFLSAISRDVPFVESPAFTAALALAAGSSSWSSADFAVDTEPSQSSYPSDALDLAQLDASVRTHANQVVASLIRERELLRKEVEQAPMRQFGSGVKAVDAALSRALDLVDAAQADFQETGVPSTVQDRRDQLQNGMDSLSSALHDLSTTASNLRSRAEVQIEIKRLQQAVDEMTDMASAVLHPSRHQSRSASVASSVLSDVGYSGDDDDDGDRASAASNTSASNGPPSRPAVPRSASTTSVASASSEQSKPAMIYGGTPTKMSNLNKSGRPRLPSSMVGLPPGRSPRSVSGPAGSPRPNSGVARQSIGSPRVISSLSARQRTVSAATSSSSGQVATPSRLRHPTQPSDFLSPSNTRSPPPGSNFSTLPRALKYHSPAPLPAKGTPSATPDHRLRPQARVSSRTQERAELAASLDGGALATPTRRSVSAAAVRSTVSRRPYVAQKGHKLDRAVGKIVNAMPIEIPIVAARESTDTETGRYWISEPPKLCFCRILRSRTVMVRVGGGWVELSKFLQDHFDTISAASPTSMLSPAVHQGDRWIPGAGPATPSRAPGARTVSQPSGPSLFPIAASPVAPRAAASPAPTDAPPATPDHGSGSVGRRARKVSGAPVTPSFSTPRSMTVLVSSPADGNSLDGSPGSPLVPLQLMRKAGDGERSSPGSSLGNASSLGLGTPTSSAASSRTTGRSTSGASTSSARSRPSIPWRF